MDNKRDKESTLREMSRQLLIERRGSEERMEEKEDFKGRKILLGIILTLIGLFVVAVLAAVIYVNYLLNRITPYDPANDATVSSAMAEQLIREDPDAVTVSPEQEADIPLLEDLPEQDGNGRKINWENVVNILLVGQDRRPGEGRQRSDSMILVTFNKAKQTVTLTSFMRDAYVSIPGYKSNKLNAAYAFGGMSLLNETLEKNYGVHIDGDVEVDFNSFKKIIDLLGGVDIQLRESEVAYLNAGMFLKGTSRELSVGTQRLDGEIALAYARLREIDTDYHRAQRQRNVISSLFQRYKELPVSEMLSLLDEILPIVVTNMDKSEIVNYTLELTPMLTGVQLNTLRIPADQTFSQGTARVRPGLAAWFQYDIDFAANREILYEIFAE
jgi:LCP family protein required for cell wall assembly